MKQGIRMVTAMFDNVPMPDITYSNTTTFDVKKLSMMTLRPDLCNIENVGNHKQLSILCMYVYIYIYIYIYIL